MCHSAITHNMVVSGTQQTNRSSDELTERKACSNFFPRRRYRDFDSG